MTSMENSENPQDLPDVTPVEETGNIDPPTAEKTGTLSVRQSMSLLKRLDEACKERGITRTELVRECLERYFDKPKQPTLGELIENLSTLQGEKEQLEQALQDCQLFNALQQPKGSDYTAELEVDLMKAVDIACNSILPTRTDFRKKLKHYSRLELGK